MLVCAELVDLCNLKCELCWNRNRKGSGHQMSLEMVDKILKCWPGARFDWYNWGEPLLHREFLTIADMVKGSISTVSSNFSFNLSDVYFEKLQNFAVVYASLSGLTSEVYAHYHHGGNFDLVMHNLERLAEARKTRVVVRWLSHPDNLHQLKDAITRFKSVGFELEHTGLNCEVEELLEGFDHPYIRVPRFRRTQVNFRCFPIQRITLSSDGRHLLCCTTHNVPIGPTVDDNYSWGQLWKLKRKHTLCQKCQENGFWRMF